MRWLSGASLLHLLSFELSLPEEYGISCVEKRVRDLEDMLLP